METILKIKSKFLRNVKPLKPRVTYGTRNLINDITRFFICCIALLGKFKRYILGVYQGTLLAEFFKSVPSSFFVFASIQVVMFVGVFGWGWYEAHIYRVYLSTIESLATTHADLCTGMVDMQA